MILGALDAQGGQEYLVRQAEENPVAFLTLLGKVLPMTLQGNENYPIHYTITTGVPNRDGSPEVVHMSAGPLAKIAMDSH